MIDYVHNVTGRYQNKLMMLRQSYGVQRLELLAVRGLNPWRTKLGSTHFLMYQLNDYALEQYSKELDVEEDIKCRLKALHNYEIMEGIAN